MNGKTAPARRPRIAVLGSHGAFTSRAVSTLCRSGVPPVALMTGADPVSDVHGPIPVEVRTPAARIAAAHGAAVIRARHPDHPDAIAALERIEPDLLLLACLPHVVSRATRRTARLGALNLHPSALPRFRGPDPVFWQLRAGVARAGVTVHVATDAVDAGPIVVQRWFGKVGYWVARFCRDAGADIVGIAERDGALADPRGLDPDAVRRHRTATGSILDFPGATTLADTRAALELPCDVLIPAALEHQITEENAPRIQARIVLEGANGPTTPEADEVLGDKGVLVIPDIYANAGGVVVSYFEWLKNLSHIRFGRIEKRYQEGAYGRILSTIETATGHRLTPDERAAVVRGPDELTVVNSGLEEIMAVAYHEIRETLARRPEMGSLRIAAMAIAIEKVARSYLSLGVFP